MRSSKPGVMSQDQSQTSVTDGDLSHTVGDKDDEEEILRQEVMADNLEVMLAIILKIREDEDFAHSIYADCPRLQHLLDQHPDLRPVFEEQKLVLVNFEQVYRKAGGVLPEDRPDRLRQILKYVVSHPLFKVFRFLLVIKKIYNCIMGSGAAMVKGCLCAMFSDHTAAAAAGAAVGAAGENLANVDADVVDPTNAANLEALNRAADYMEGPEVQERMQTLLESDPENLDEAIEQDPELKALRDSNPLCAELMNDPETMKILVDPDNLRALAECPDLIAADFSDPDWSPPDVENDATFDEGAVVSAEVEIEDVGAEDVGAEEVGADAEGEEGEEEGLLEGYELGDEPEKTANKTQRSTKQATEKESSAGGFISMIGTGLMDYIASETVGFTASEIMGAEDDFGASVLDDQADQAANAVDGAAASAGEFDTVVASAEYAVSDDVTGKVEETMDMIEESNDDREEGNDRANASVSVAAAGGAVVADRAGNVDKEDVPKKGVFRKVGRVIGGSLSALSVAATEQVATTLLGDSLGSELMERLEESGDDANEDQAEAGKTKSQRSVFGPRK